jgi:hypothetical protein
MPGLPARAQSRSSPAGGSGHRAAIGAIGDALAVGRPLPDSPELRELIIPFAGSGYVTLYRNEPADDTVYVLAFRHQREAGTEARGSAPLDFRESRPATAFAPPHFQK